MPRKKGIPKHNPNASSFTMQDHQLTRGLTNVNVNQLSDVESDSSYDDIFTDLPENERVYLSDIVSDDETNEWDDKLLLPDNERSKVFSKETGDFIRDELKKTQAIIAKQKRIENALKKIRTGTTSSSSSSSSSNEPRAKRTRRSTVRFEPEPDSMDTKKAMRASMPRKEYVNVSSSSNTRVESQSKTICDSPNDAKLTRKLCGPKSWKKRVREAERDRDRNITRKKREESNKHGVEANYNTSTGTIRDGKYYCMLCNAGGWAGPSGLWYHMKRVHKAKSRNYVKRKPENRKMGKKKPTLTRRKVGRPKTTNTTNTTWEAGLQLSRNIRKQRKEANLLLGFAEGAAIEEENTKKVIINTIINKLQTLFRKFNNPDGANIFIELINNNSSYGEIIIKETKNYIEKTSIRDKEQIKKHTMDFLQTLALIKRQHSREQLNIFEGFAFEELDVHDTGEKDDDGNTIKIIASENKFGGRKSRKKRRKSRKKRRKLRKKTRKKRKRKKRTKKRR